MTTAGWNAADYAANSSAQEKWAEELLQKLSLEGDEALLDLGCGDGRITARIAASLPQGKVVGVDVSADMIALAGRSHGADNLCFTTMDAAALQLPQVFDVAFSNAALHWVGDHERMLLALTKHLSPGARLLFQMGGKGNASAIVEAFQAVMVQPAWADHFTQFIFPYTFHDDRHYRELLTATGYDARRVALVEKDMVHASPAQLRGWLRTTWFPFIGCVPEPGRELFLDEVLRGYLKNTPTDAAGQTHVRMVRLEVEAVYGGRGA